MPNWGKGKKADIHSKKKNPEYKTIKRFIWIFYFSLIKVNEGFTLIYMNVCVCMCVRERETCLDIVFCWWSTAALLSNAISTKHIWLLNIWNVITPNWDECKIHTRLSMNSYKTLINISYWLDVKW